MNFLVRRLVHLLVPLVTLMILLYQALLLLLLQVFRLAIFISGGARASSLQVCSVARLVLSLNDWQPPATQKFRFEREALHLGSALTRARSFEKLLAK